MLARSEHQRVLGQLRRAAGRAASVHRDAVSGERSRWKLERAQLKDARAGHRSVLQAERGRLVSARKEHKVALRRDRWLMALVSLLESRMRRST